MTVTEVSTTCAVVIFRVKVSCVTSVDGIILWDQTSFAKKKKKKTQANKQTERTLPRTPQQLWPITLSQDTNNKIKARNIKQHSDTRKTTTTYNKLLDETRYEHCYILNR